ncbi:hypothetical protein L6472_02435 [Prevotella sp. E13-17]|uniref:hypothetical protein n=1 Tax=Prevotella sp. E13-17 TaxID=2913616 RepID=UPI001EDB0DB7|nr:hypothetical protein [Prevotella sp. E13-17]UKK51469.1 hypothetical protein L6472_02435 [Prevotella sp. E13-17]
MIHKFRYILTLVALFAMTAGAWAQSYEAKVFDVPASWAEDQTKLSAADLPKDFVQITKEEAKALAVPDGSVILIYGFEGENVKVLIFSSGTLADEDEAPEVRGMFRMYQTDANIIICYPAPGGPKVAWNAANKTGTFTMPGSDVVLTPIYAKTAAFATTGTEPEVKTLLPEAAEGVIAGTDASLIAEGTGIVAFAGTSTEDTQGTLMYAIGTSATEAPALTAFSATVPTAENVADDGGNVYVWYYIKGVDAPEGVAATLDNTFENTEPACLTVTVLTNKFDITFNAANANTIEAGKATVTVGGTAATVTEGKLEGVKMGSEVKVKANTGYKFRKVEVKKGGAKPTLAATLTTAGMTVKVSFLLVGNAETVNFTSNGDGTYTKTGGTGTTATAPDWIIQLVENSGMIVFKAYPNDENENSKTAFKFNFFPSDNTYYMWAGNAARDLEPTFTSISVNDTAIAVTEAQDN